MDGQFGFGVGERASERGRNAEMCIASSALRSVLSGEGDGRTLTATDTRPHTRAAGRSRAELEIERGRCVKVRQIGM